MSRNFCRLLPIVLALTQMLGVVSFSGAAHAFAPPVISPQLSLPQQPLQDALMTLSEQANVTIYADNQLLNDIQSPAYQGSAEVAKVLFELLKNTPLTFKQQGDNLFVIVAKPRFNEPKFAPSANNSSQPQQRIEEIITTGQRLWNKDYDHARQQQWVGDNLYMSAETVAQSPGSGIPDIVGALPGVTAFSDMRLGQAATGESEYLSVRNMGSQYTSAYIDGIPVHTADPSTRSVSLKMLTPVNIGAIRVNKTPDATWLGKGVGGVLNITTPTAFDKGDDYRHISLGTSVAQLRQQRELDDWGQQLALEWADLSHHQHLGVYAAAYYEKRYSAAESIEVGTYSEDDNPQANDIRFDFYQAAIRKVGASLSLDWQQQGSEFFLRSTYNQYDSNGYDVQQKLARHDLDGMAGVSTNAYFQTRDSYETLATVKLGGLTQLTDKLQLDYQVSTAFNQIKRPDYIESSLNSPIKPGAFNFDVANPNSSKLSFADGTQQFLLNHESVRVRKYQGNDEAHKNNTLNAKFSLHYQPEHYIDQLQAGVAYQHSQRSHYSRPLTGDRGGNFYIPLANGELPDTHNPQGPSGASLPGRDINFMGGLIPQFRVYDPDYFVQSMLPYAYQDLYTNNGTPNPGDYTLDDWNRNSISGHEARFTLFLQAQKQWGSWRIVPGLVLDNYRLSARHWDTSASPHQFVPTRAEDFNVLPSLNLSYQYSDSLTMKAAIRKAITRPDFGDLAGSTQYYFDSGSDSPSEIALSNPDLESQRALNLDASLHWYPAPHTLFEASLYYKNIDNLVYTVRSSIPLSSATSPESTTLLTQPQNGNQATLVGTELHLRHQISALDSAWNGFGFDLAMNLQDSDTHYYGDSVRSVDMLRTPKQSYKLQLFHETAQFRTALQWRYTGKQLLSYTDSSLDKYLQSREILNLTATYRRDAWTLNLQINNLLNAPTFYKTLGASRQYLGTQDAGGNGSFVQTGRFLALQLEWDF